MDKLQFLVLILHNRAKFSEDWSIPCDIAIYVVFQDDDRAILVFEKFKILTVCPP